MVLMKEKNSIKHKIKIFLRKFLFPMFSVWSYIPIIMGILFPMVIILTITYASWIIFSLLPESWFFYGYIPISHEHLFQYIVILVIKIIVFIGGMVIFLCGLYHLTKGKRQKISIVKKGIYHYIRHPQNLVISLMALLFSFYIPRFNDIGIRIGEIFSWLLFTFILTMYSNLEELYLLKKFPEEYSIYQHQTGFFYLNSTLKAKRLSKDPSLWQLANDIYFSFSIFLF